MPIVLGPSSGSFTGDIEELELNGLELNNDLFGLLEVAFPPPAQRQEWIGAADSEHMDLVRNPLHENRTITAKIQITPQAQMDDALAAIASLVDELQAASATRAGIPLTWSPAASTLTCTFDVLAGQITDMPITWADGWLAQAPTITVVLTAKPYWRGELVTLTAESADEPFVTLEIPDVPGDVPALGILTVTDLASQSRRHVEWGLEGPATYDPATSLLVDSDDMIVSGFAGAQETNTGFDPNATGTTNIIASVYPTPIAVCGLGHLEHVGTFRVKARLASGQADATSLRLSWQAGDGPASSNAWVSPAHTFTWEEMDLGTITIPASSGAQRWTGQIEGMLNSGYAAGTPVYVDYLVLVPVTNGYGKARASYTYRPGVVVGSDEFTGMAGGASLNGRTAAAGGTWATSGAATDFVRQAFLEYLHRVAFASSAYRFAVLGSTNRTNVEASVNVMWSLVHVGGAGDGRSSAVIARWTDSNNHLRGVMTSDGVISIETVISGTATPIATGSVSLTGNNWYTLRLVAFATGQTVLQVLTAAGGKLAELSTSHASLVTGGTLETGETGFADAAYVGAAGIVNAYFDSVSVSTPAPEPVVMYSGRDLTITHDDVSREDSTGTYIGRPESYRGSRFTVPVGTSRLLVKARRSDIETGTDEYVEDDTQIQVAYTPRGLVVPR